MLRLRAVHLLAIALTLVVVLAAAQSSVDEQLKKIHKKLASNGSGLGLQITPPTLAVIGLQSAVRSPPLVLTHLLHRLAVPRYMDATLTSERGPIGQDQHD